ncbi:MAG: cache domain-containing protein [Spongiibacteraceae bacterium]
MARKPITDTLLAPNRKYSITRLYWAGLILLAAVPMLVLGYFWVADQYGTFREQSASLRQSYLDSRELYLRREAGEVLDYIEFKSGEIDQRLRSDLQDVVNTALLALTPDSAAAAAADLAQQRERARKLMKKVSFGGGGDHLFMLDADGVVMLMPTDPKATGRAADSLRDAAGAPYLLTALSQARLQGEGFVAAWLPKPLAARNPSQTAYSTQVYLRFFPALNLYIGAIGYVEDRVLATQQEVLARFRAAATDDLLLSIVDYDGNVILASQDGIGEGASVNGLRDADGQVIASQLRAAIDRPDGVLIRSRWQDKTEKREADSYLQINYVRAYRNWRWIVATGFALHELDAMIEKQREEMKRRVQQRIAYVGLAIVVLLLLATLFAQRLATKTRLALRQFNHHFEESNRGNTRIDVEQLPLLEFEQLAIDANRMLDYRVGIERELVAARIAAESANQAKSQFLSTMSHELRTPLNGVLGYAQILMRDPKLTPDQHRHLSAIASCGQHLLTLINDVLDLAKIESGALEIQSGSCNLYQLLQTVSDIVRGKAEAKGLSFRLEIAPQLPEHAWLDEVKLRQVLINLLGNAVKFTDSGSLILSAQTDKTGAQLEFAVTDTGIGIARNRLQEIFQPFRQAHAHGGGNGLGLAISERVSAAMGGHLQVESALGAGSCFKLTLPYVQATASARDSAPALPGGQVLELPSTPLRVMVVDDNAANRMVLAGLLRSLGCEIAEAENGLEALAKLRTQPLPLVFMDVRMALMDGIEATRRIKQDPELSHIVVIAVSASVFPEVVEQMRIAGCDDFINKPVKFSELAVKLSQHLGLPLRVGPQPAVPASLLGGEVLPPDLQQVLRAAIAEGDLEAMYDALQFAERDGHLPIELVQRLRTLLDNFDIETVRDLLAPTMEAL